MRKLGIFFLLIIFPVCVSGQSAEVRKELGVEMNATTSIVDLQACVDESGSDSNGRKTWAVRVDLVMSVNYANTGQMPIILDKSNGTIGGQSLSKSEQDALARKYEYDVSQTWMWASLNPRIEDGKSPGDRFVVLNPGEHYENKTETRLLIHRPEQYKLFSSDAHFLTFGMWTTDGTLSEANNVNELRTRWRKYGYLWTEGITTQPMPINFPKLEELKSCQ